MTCAETKQWMKEKNYLRHWLLPMNGINKGTSYDERPVGNSPYFCPLDNSLFNDLKFGTRLNVASTMYDKIRDPKLIDVKTRIENEFSDYKFKMDTPQNIFKSVNKLWSSENGIPTSDRIVEDVNRAADAYHLVAKAKGQIVHGLVTREGHRNVKQFCNSIYHVGERRREQKG